MISRSLRGGACPVSGGAWPGHVRFWASMVNPSIIHDPSTPPFPQSSSSILVQEGWREGPCRRAEEREQQQQQHGNHPVNAPTTRPALALGG
jgi:hypothetical protein